MSESEYHWTSDTVQRFVTGFHLLHFKRTEFFSEERLLRGSFWVPVADCGLSRHLSSLRH